MKITERLDKLADNMWNRGDWGPDLDTVKDAKEHIEKLENALRAIMPQSSSNTTLRSIK
jgi:hypothetical protein